jgi:hypothetical protein
MNYELVMKKFTQFKLLKPRASQDELWAFKLSNLNRRQCKWNHKHMKYIQREKTKLISPPLESFLRDFKDFCICIQFSFKKLQ